MIEIDLLPSELRKKKKLPFEVERIFNKKLLYFVLGALLIFHLFLHAIDLINIKRLNSINKNWQALSAQKKQIDQLQGELSQINKKVPLLEQLIKNRVSLSEKLNRLSDLIITGIWLNELGLEGQKTAEGKVTQSLIIRGSAASRIKNEPALIGRFMQNLKDDPSFSQDFSEIELGPITKRQISQTEIMDFILICRFKPDKAEALLK